MSLHNSAEFATLSPECVVRLFPPKSTSAHPQKETPYEKKAREALANHKAKEATKLLASKQKEARAILDKVAPVLASIESLEGVPEFGMVAAPLLEPLKDKKGFLDRAVASALMVMASSEAADLPELVSLKEVLDTIANAKKVIALITNVLAAIARAHR
jgi:hypothetical protein